MSGNAVVYFNRERVQFEMENAYSKRVLLYFNIILYFVWTRK